MTNDATPTAILRDQHRNILKVADILEEVLSNEREPGAFDYKAIELCIDFIRLYADALHHGKEEDLLFPELEARGMPRDSGPIAVMLQEHQQGRVYVKHMRDAFEPARGGDQDAAKRLLHAGLGYVSLIRGHILKEDNVLFGMADQMIEGPACQALCARYDGVCAHTFEGHTVSELEGLLRQLQGMYP
ncbi:MAG TPA: hemerythrin domain-containing protein [Longimicrobiales bacterium]|jgi:hemerythrin-like domain-containing protein